jgi:IS30 family transposase
MRLAMIKLREKGLSIRKISELLDVPVMTISDHIKRYEETGRHENKPKGRPEKSSRNRRNIQRAKGMIKRNPTTKVNSTRKLAKKLGISQTSFARTSSHETHGRPTPLILTHWITRYGAFSSRKHAPSLSKQLNL